MLSICTGASQVVFSLGHQHRSTDVTSLYCSNHGPVHAVGTVGTAQTGLFHPYMYVPTKPTAVKARPVSDAEALMVCSDVPQTLIFQSQEQVCMSVFFMGVGRDFGEGNGNLLQYSCLENPRDGAWWVAVYGVTQS